MPNNLNNARKYSSDSRLMSRMARLLSNFEYPYKDKAQVLNQVKDFLSLAQNEGNFLAGEDAPVYHSYYDPFLSLKVSAHVLHKENAITGSIGDIAELVDQLEEITSVVNKLIASEELEETEQRSARMFFLSLKSCFDELVRDSSRPKETNEQPVYLVASG